MQGIYPYNASSLCGAEYIHESPQYFAFILPQTNKIASPCFLVRSFNLAKTSEAIWADRPLVMIIITVVVVGFKGSLSYYSSGIRNSRRSPDQNGRNFADGIFKCIFLSENLNIWPKIHQNMFNGLIDKKINIGSFYGLVSSGNELSYYTRHWPIQCAALIGQVFLKLCSFIQWNMSVTTTSVMKFITCDLFSYVI